MRKREKMRRWSGMVAVTIPVWFGVQYWLTSQIGYIQNLSKMEEQGLGLGGGWGLAAWVVSTGGLVSQIAAAIWIAIWCWRGVEFCRELLRGRSRREKAYICAVVVVTTAICWLVFAWYGPLAAMLPWAAGACLLLRLLRPTTPVADDGR